MVVWNESSFKVNDIRKSRFVFALFALILASLKLRSPGTKLNIEKWQMADSSKFIRLFRKKEENILFREHFFSRYLLIDLDAYTVFISNCINTTE